MNPINNLNKKAFKPNVNRALADSMSYIVNKFEHAWEMAIPVW